MRCRRAFKLALRPIAVTGRAAIHHDAIDIQRELEGKRIGMGVTRQIVRANRRDIEEYGCVIFRDPDITGSSQAA